MTRPKKRRRGDKEKDRDILIFEKFQSGATIGDLASEFRMRENHVYRVCQNMGMSLRCDIRPPAIKDVIIDELSPLVMDALFNGEISFLKLRDTVKIGKDSLIEIVKKECSDRGLGEKETNNILSSRRMAVSASDAYKAYMRGLTLREAAYVFQVSKMKLKQLLMVYVRQNGSHVLFKKRRERRDGKYVKDSDVSNNRDG